MSDQIECAICNRKFKQIQHRHLKQHGITFEEYIQKYPNHPTCSQGTRNARAEKMIGREITWAEKISQSNKSSWKENPNQGRTGVPLSENSKKIVSEKLMGHEVSEETRIKIGLAGLGRTPWNKGLTKESDPRLISVSEKIKEWNKEHMTPAIREQISQTLKQRYANGMKIPQAKGNFRVDLNKYFRSTWEANYARILNSQSTPWTYEEFHFTISDGDDILFVYTPDFYINNNEFIELKGHANSNDEWECDCKRCQRDKMKMSLFYAQYPDKDIKLIGKKEYRDLARNFSRVIDNWEKSSYDQ